MLETCMPPSLREAPAIRPSNFIQWSGMIFRRIVIPLHLAGWNTIFIENRFPLFGIMLSSVEFRTNGIGTKVNRSAKTNFPSRRRGQSMCFQIKAGSGWLLWFSRLIRFVVLPHTSAPSRLPPPWPSRLDRLSSPRPRRGCAPGRHRGCARRFRPLSRPF